LPRRIGGAVLGRGGRAAGGWRDAGDADLIIRFAGTAGEGVLTVGDLLGRIIARTGRHVLGTVRYDAEVRGRSSR